jgi:hypothetical protein
MGKENLVLKMVRSILVIFREDFQMVKELENGRMAIYMKVHTLMGSNKDM